MTATEKAVWWGILLTWVLTFAWVLVTRRRLRQTNAKLCELLKRLPPRETEVTPGVAVTQKIPRQRGGGSINDVEPRDPYARERGNRRGEAPHFGRRDD